MASSLRYSVVLVMALALAACSSGGGSDAAPPATARLVVATSTTLLTPSSAARPSVDPSVIAASNIGSYYRVTTPADAPFAFDLVAWSAGASGSTQVSIRHLKDGNVAPAGDASWIDAGITPQGRGLTRGGGWLGARGDGTARLTLQGRIQRDQLLAVTADTGEVTLVEIAIGPTSEIARPISDGAPLPPGSTRQTIYSSDSWQFGLPTVAVSGDRTSIVCYEGDHLQPTAEARFELRMQHDAVTGAVTGGASPLAAGDSGYWRDHEIVALYNVLGVVRGEAEGVRVRLSFDRGATFAQELVVAPGIGPSRLVQAAMAADYSLAIGAWRQAANGSGLEFVLIEGQPLAFDPQGSPTWFAFSQPQVVHTMPIESSPMNTGIAWSAGGDLVVGYGASWFASLPDRRWSSTAEYRCAVRLYGGQTIDTLVDRELVVGVDPTVAVLGQGAGMRIFYGYEGRDGVRMATSSDAGATFGAPITVGLPGDHLPTVLARETAGVTKVDLLYLGYRDQGTELHAARWADWPQSPREDLRLTVAQTQNTTPPQVPGGPFPWYPFSMRTTQVSWLGYDAMLDGDVVVVAYDEVTFDNVMVCLGAPLGVGDRGLGGPVASPTGGFHASEPPPLAPGLTQPVRSVNAADAHQLVLLRLR
jgi:hypothetical protein